MPFNWDQSYIDLVQMVHEELRLPKEFKPYQEINGFKGYINDVEVDNRIIILDPYSYEDLNVVHFLVTGNELQRIKGEITNEDTASDGEDQPRTTEKRIVPHILDARQDHPRTRLTK